MPLNINFQQIFLHMLNFIILFGALYFLLYNPVKKFMDHRNDSLKAELEKSENAMAAAEALKAEYTEKMAAADAEIAEAKNRSAQEAAEAARAVTAEAETRAAEILESARGRAKEEADALIRGAQRSIRELAAESAGKLVSEDSSEAFDCFLELVEQEEEN